MTEVTLVENTDRGAVIIDKNRNRRVIPADAVILSLRLEPRTAAIHDFESLQADVYGIGDCLKPRTIKEAVHDGFNVAVEI